MKEVMLNEKLAAAWQVDIDDVGCILEQLDAKRWAGGESLESIAYAGFIDDDSGQFSHGHNGYWIADSDKHICYVTNGDPVFAEWDEETVDEIGVNWGEFAEEMANYKI